MGKPIGPGPGAYMLPPNVGFDKHDATKFRNPMFSFGYKFGYMEKARAPGPIYKIDRMTRSGKTDMPAWTLASRFPYRKVDNFPGPGAHAPERCPPMKNQRPPSYSLGGRLGYQERSRGPAPNAYAIHLGPSTPKYSMGGRLGYETKTKSPGPAVYFQKDIEVYQNRSPKFSLGAKLGRNLNEKNPGPATYPPDLYNYKKRLPAFSFGVKHWDYAPPMVIPEDTMDCL